MVMLFVVLRTFCIFTTVERLKFGFLSGFYLEDRNEQVTSLTIEPIITLHNL